MREDIELDPAFTVPATYLSAGLERRRYQRLAQLRCGADWLAETTGRWERLSREQRQCPHCPAPMEDAHHMVFACPLYERLREQFADIFQGVRADAGPAAPLATFLGQTDQSRVAKFVHLCHEAHTAAREQR